MSISVFNTKKFKENLFYVRSLNAVVVAMILLPVLIYFCAECPIQGIGEFLCMLGLSLMIFGIPIIGIVAFINDTTGPTNSTVRIILSILLAPTIIIVEPIYRLIYKCLYGRAYKRQELYRMVGEFKGV
jgi:hypothetical protein